MTVRAIYENGVFRPTQPVTLPDKTEVNLEATPVAPIPPAQPLSQVDKEIFDILSNSYDTGQTDAAARHDEHHP